MSGTTDEAVSSVPSDQGELRIVMSLIKPEIILVEDATKLETEALIMTVTVYYNHHSDCGAWYLGCINYY